MLLMHENIPVADVSMYLGQITSVNKVITPEHLPVGTNHPGPMLYKYLNSWQKDRAIPFNRQSLDIYTKYFGKTPLEAAQVFGSFSLTDHYWFKADGDNDKWENLCFQINGFSNNFSDFFLDTMASNIPMGERALAVPDANTDGVLPKMWLQSSTGEFYLYKLGEYASLFKQGDMNGCHILSANEVACSRIAKEMGLDAVEYKSAEIVGIPNPVCVSKNFVPSDMEFVTLAQIAKEHAGTKFDLYGHIVDMGYKQEVEDMIRFFFLIHNKDGHTKNCGFLRNAKTLKIERFAPLFDHGCSLNYDGLGSADQSVKPFRASRLEQLALVENIGETPSFDKISEIVKKTYDEFNIPDMQKDLALQDLIDTCNEWEQIVEKDEKDYE